MPNSENWSTLRYALYYHFLLGHFDSLSNLEDMLVYLLDDPRYPIGFGDSRGYMAEGLLEEMCRVRDMHRPEDIMQIWQAARHIFCFFTNEQQEEFRLFLRDLPINLEA